MKLFNLFLKKYKFASWIFICFLISLPTILVFQIIPGLDPSWKLGISMAIEKGFVFGKDFVFTYGPLGFLDAKITIVISKYYILLFEMVMVIFSLYIAIYAYNNSKNKLTIAIMTILILLLLKSNDLTYLVMPSFIFFILYSIHFKSLTHLVLATALSALSLYIKVNYGIILIGLTYFSFIFIYVRRIFPLKTIVLCITWHIFLILVLTFLLNVSLYNYIIASLHFINAYNDTMNIFTIPPIFLYMALAIVTFYLFGFILNYKFYLENFTNLFTFLIGAFLLFLLFKNGFVRADGHAYDFFKFSPLPFILVYLFSDEKTKIKWGYIIIIALTISFFMLKENFITKSDSTASLAKKYLGVDYFNDVFSNTSHRNSFSKNDHNLPKIDSLFLNNIGSQTVDVIPWEISLIYFNNLNYNPRPVIQSYAAYDTYLDSLNSQKYASNSAPTFILYSPMSIDNRNPIWDESITKRVISTHYEIVENNKLNDLTYKFDEDYYLKKYPDVAAAVASNAFKSGFRHFFLIGKREGRSACESCVAEEYFLLQKRARPLKWETINVENKELEFGKEYYLKQTPNNQFLFATINYSLFGKLRRLLFQPPAFFVELKYKDSTVISYKGITTIMSSGVLLNKSINDFNETMLYFKNGGITNENILSIKFVAETGFEKNINAQVKEMKLIK